ncbi:MAG: SusF/SusE family outer membrane protein [Bacteroidales bacterium]|nr:SusF/SusE family outer membrane protein [Bacteroidales bacterium]MCF8346866.1 SusF/SusE family outer membrane protein [Bacteroidales bacterium]
MNNRSRRIKSIAIRLSRADSFFIALLLLLLFVAKSCDKEFEIVVSDGEAISLAASDTSLVLSQKFFSSNAIDLIWTRGSNQGTGSPISYILEMDMSDNNFSSPLIFDIGKAIYKKSFSVDELNNLLTGTFGVEAGASATIEARVIADILNESVKDDISDPVSFSVRSYKPVGDQLYILGTATLFGDDILNATEMTRDQEKPWEFVYEGELNRGRIFFSETRDDCWCKTFYTRNTSDDGLMIRNEEGLGDNKRWLITSKNYYKVVVDLIDLKIQIDTTVAAAYTELYIVGDASPSGWNIATPFAFTQNPDDANIFTYEAFFTPGNFKISTFTGDWCDGDWLNANQADQDLSATDFIITRGCDGPDNQWLVTEETQGRYTITINLIENSISITPVQLYLIGDGGPNGWNIEDPEPMVFADGIYTFAGPLGADNPTGEFKFSKFTGNWCDGGWILATTIDQSITNTSMSYYTGCPPDELDFKWKLAEGEAGDYVITIDLENEVMTITKQ